MQAVLQYVGKATSPNMQTIAQVLIYWYLVVYEPQPFIVRPKVVIGEFDNLADCTDQQDVFYFRNPWGFARCEGSPYRQSISTKDELEMQKLQVEIEKDHLEAEIKKRILKGELPR